jgi:hypothetical protein
MTDESWVEIVVCYEAYGSWLRSGVLVAYNSGRLEVVRGESRLKKLLQHNIHE